MEFGGFRFTSMEVMGSLHKNTWKFPLSVEAEASIASVNCSSHERVLFFFLFYVPFFSPLFVWRRNIHSLEASMSFHIPPIYFHLLLRVSQTPSSFHKTSTRVHRLPFALLPWKFPPTFLEVHLLPWKSMIFHGRQFTSMKVSGCIRSIYFHGNLLPWNLVEVDLLPSKLLEASMEVHRISTVGGKGIFHLLPSVAASTDNFRGSFHELPYTPTHFRKRPRVSQTSCWFHKTKPNPRLKLPPWKLAYF